MPQRTISKYWNCGLNTVLLTLPCATEVVAMSSTKLSPLAAGAAKEIGFVPRVGCLIQYK